ncbi:unnamed protein product [Moneuplotes crassus]|uniref:Uncharacterized protein n=1 Tax=Euplotes crassus TaxID=5936 RepID=A0AAD1UTR6_EUPCR|nr:unnamed protein product [Moneuplotes crassus]
MSPSKRSWMQNKIMNSIDWRTSSKKHFRNNFGPDFSLLENRFYNPFKNKIPNRDIQSHQRSFETLPTLQVHQRRESISSQRKMNLRMITPAQPTKRSLSSLSIDEGNPQENRHSQGPNEVIGANKNLHKKVFCKITCNLKDSTSSKDVNQSYDVTQSNQPITFDLSMRDVMPIDQNFDLIEEDQYGINKTFSKRDKAPTLMKKFLLLSKSKEMGTKRSAQLLSRPSSDPPVAKDSCNLKVYSDYCSKLQIPFKDPFIKGKYYALQRKWSKDSQSDRFYKRMMKDSEKRVHRKQVINKIFNKPNRSKAKDLCRKRHNSHGSARKNETKIKSRIPPFINLKDLMKMVKIPRKVYRNDQ